MAVQYSYEHHNVRKIFNHDIPSGIREDVAGNHLYSGRALGLSEPHDIIQIHPFLKREWEAISGHYDRVGLPHSKNVVWDVSLDRLEEFPELQASVFFFGPSETGLSGFGRALSNCAPAFSISRAPSWSRKDRPRISRTAPGSRSPS